MARLILVRHAQSAANRDGVGLGRTDSPLTGLGRRQAAALGAALADRPVHRVLASPLQRAQSTAQAIVAAQTHSDAKALSVETDDRLIEMDVGELEGLDWPLVQERYGDFMQRWLDDDASEIKMPGGESLADVARRAWPAVEPFIEPVLDHADVDPGWVVVVSHNFVLRTLVCGVLGLPLHRWRSFELDLASRSMVERVRGRPVIVELNDTSHLDDELHVISAQRSERQA